MKLERFVFAYLQRRMAQAGKPMPTDTLRKHVAIERLATPSTSLARFELRFRRGNLAVELNARDGEPMSWSWPELQKPPGSSMTRPAALDLATRTAQPSPTAHLAYAEVETLDGRQVFVARWEHREDEILVEGDHIQVMIALETGRVFAHHRRWHEVSFEPTPR